MLSSTYSGTIREELNGFEAGFAWASHSQMGSREIAPPSLASSEDSCPRMPIPTEMLASARGTCDCEPVEGSTLRCIAPYGVAFRAGPDFGETPLGVLRTGSTITVMERSASSHWIREGGGWLPTLSPRGLNLFEIVA
mmetsp:Transcript_107957/g.170551  ORF Transcript_107957/g.170551 Transcript_107957/m.170551 type:complete len:138 (-) Transcript_107957:411-824(-)